MGNHLDIGLAEFKRMKRIDRDAVFFKNLIHIRETIGDYRKSIGDYKFHKKIQYVWLIVLSAILGIRKYLGMF